MKLSQILKISIFVVQAFASVAFASSVSVANPKEDLAGVEGEYKVTTTSSSAEDPFCSQDSEYTVRWFDSRKGLALSIGEGILSFSNLNDAPKEEPEDQDGKACTVSINTQTEKGRLTQNMFTKCGKETTTELTVLKVSQGMIDYKKEIKKPIKGKTVIVTSACTLKKI